MRALSAERGGDPDRPGKKNPLDPMLWMAAATGRTELGRRLVGPGRPGWHIECVAIALDHLGMGFDVQGGGSDLVFPHHEMGASHAQALTGEFPFAKAYVHAGMVALDGEKMSKSKGNLVFVSTLRRAGVDPAAIRLALLSRHYRSDWEWTDAVLAEATDRLVRWRAAVSRPDGPPAEAARRADQGGARRRPGRAGGAGRGGRLGRPAALRVGYGHRCAGAGLPGGGRAAGSGAVGPDGSNDSPAVSPALRGGGHRLASC